MEFSRAKKDWRRGDDVEASVTSLFACQTGKVDGEIGEERRGQQREGSRYGRPDFDWRVEREMLD